ncbi:MAG: type II toxin-antitoxin system VapC family toxin [Nitrococcus sp.]|nr:type II toxin-antitoxin system VapC family toxin [Nitrococcus sp.]
MIAIDTNILIAALDQEHEAHPPATEFLGSLDRRTDVVISEFVLVELYGLLRNPRVVRNPLSARHAVDICGRFRGHPCWRLFGFPPDSEALHAILWENAAKQQFARRRIYDLRLALSLVQQGVTNFATVNVKDFSGCGFERVWDPL